MNCTVKFGNKKLHLGNSKNISSVIMYFLILVMVIFNRDTLPSLVSIGFYKTLVIQGVAIIGIFIFVAIKNRNHIELEKKAFFSALGLTITMLLSSLLKLDFQFYIFSIIFYIGTALFLTHIFNIENFYSRYSNIMVFLAVYSLMTCYLFRPILFPNNTINPNLNTIVNSSGTPFFNCGFSYVVAWPYYFRNFGLFREPGIYQFFLLIALFYELLLRQKSFRIFHILVLSVTVFSTFSPPGILGLFIVFGIFIFKMALDKRITTRMVVFTVVIALLGIGLISLICVINVNIRHLIVEMIQKVFTINASSGARINSLLVSIRLFIHHPFVGNAFNTVVAENGACINSNLSYYAIFGVLAGTLLLWIQYQITKLVSNKRLIRILVFIFSLLLVNTQLLYGNIIFWVFLFSAFMNSNDEPTLFQKVGTRFKGVKKN